MIFLFGAARAFTVAALGGAGWVAAQVDGEGLGTLLNYGVVGLLALALATEILVTKPALNRVLKERDRAVEQRDEIIKMQHEQVIPLLEKINSRLVPLMERVSRKIDG